MDSDLGILVSHKSDPYKPFQSILVVDDHADFLSMIGNMLILDHLNTLIVTCTRPKKAMPLTESLVFDVVLTDMDMPGCRGDELIHLIRGRSPTTHILAITGGGTDFILRAGSAGISSVDFFEKDCNHDKLVKRIRTCLSDSLEKQTYIINNINNQPINTDLKRKQMNDFLGYSARNYSILRNRVNALALLNLELKGVSKSELALLAGYSTFQKMSANLPAELL